MEKTQRFLWSEHNVPHTLEELLMDRSMKKTRPHMSVSSVAALRDGWNSPCLSRSTAQPWSAWTDPQSGGCFRRAVLLRTRRVRTLRVIEGHRPACPWSSQECPPSQSCLNHLQRWFPGGAKPELSWYKVVQDSGLDVPEQKFSPPRPIHLKPLPQDAIRDVVVMELDVSTSGLMTATLSDRPSERTSAGPEQNVMVD